MPMPRIIHGWRTWYVYDAAGVLRGTHGGFHEEAARREVAANLQVDPESLTAERVPRDGTEGC